MVPGGVDPAAFLLGGASPQQENEARFFGVESLDNAIGKLLPTPLVMRTREARFNCQGRIEE